MYEPLLLIHSWTRWLVLLSIIYFFTRSVLSGIKGADWTTADNNFVWFFNQIFGYQVLFGLTLWLAFSPLVKAGFKNLSLVSDPTIFFWMIRHGLTMILALGAFHFGHAKAKKASPEKRFQIYAATFGMILVMIISAIPWPWLSYGRALFRFVL